VRILLFTGKGGVGKTTVAAATAVRLAHRGAKVLVLSADPAHSLADVLDRPLGREPAEVEPGLFAANLDTRALIDESWQRLRKHLGTVLAGAGIDEVAAEELTLLPGVEELLALGRLVRLAGGADLGTLGGPDGGGPWETVIVDCAPTAETLRLLALPEALAGYLERLFPAHLRAVRGVFTGLARGGRAAGTQRWDATLDALSRLAADLAVLRELLTGPDTSVRLVTTPERVVAAETRRTTTTLALLGITVDGMVANRVLPEVAPGARGPAAAWLRTRRAEQDAVLATLEGGLGCGSIRVVAHRAREPVGPAALRELGEQLYPGDTDPLGGQRPAAPLLSVSRLGGGPGGRSTQAEYDLRIALPLPRQAELDLAIVGDDLAITVDGRRRLLGLPAVLLRCRVMGATVDDDGLLVRFRPDPAVWMR
jgi:arsenite-transporting ATPase